MPCLNPISIINPSKYISLSFKDRYLLQVPCGSCAECQKMVSNQWNYRTYYEFADCISNGGFVYYDTLSYDNKHLPHIKELIPDSDFNYSCFRKKDITDFLKRIRINVERKHFVKLRYFLSTEYGHDKLYRDYRGRVRRGTNRPHYHVLFFVYGTIDPLDFSRAVSSAWSYGMTDGIPYKTLSYVLSHNVIATNTLENVLRTANYITKYVQKSCEFKETIEKRIIKVMNHFAKKFAETGKEDKWLSSPAAARIRRKLNSMVNQFHRQSLYYGVSALSEIDIAKLFEDGYLVMPHYKNVKVKVAIPTYYKRKLFYRLLEIDGQKTWQLNDLGVQYKKYRDKKLFDNLTSRLQAACIQYHLDYDCRALADYILHERGRIKALQPSETFEQKLEQLDLFNYITMTDKENLLVRGLTPQWLGNSAIGYNVEVMPPCISIRDFISKYVILDKQKEKELSTIYYNLSFIDKGKQDAYKLKQHLRQVYKCFV